jgi:hypothetical protein
MYFLDSNRNICSVEIDANYISDFELPKDFHSSYKYLREHLESLKFTISDWADDMKYFPLLHVLNSSRADEKIAQKKVSDANFDF